MKGMGDWVNDHALDAILHQRDVSVQQKPKATAVGGFAMMGRRLQALAAG
jgi:hypothetical protein